MCDHGTNGGGIDNDLAKHIANLILAPVLTRYPTADSNAGLDFFVEQVLSWEPVDVRTFGSLNGAVVLTKSVEARWGAPEAWLHVTVDGSSEANSWANEQIQQLGPSVPPSASCRIPAERSALLPALREIGFGFSKLGLGGYAPDMLKKFEETDLVEPEEAGVELRVVSTMEEVRASSALRRDYFVNNPEHGWASTLTDEQQRAIDERVEGEMAKRLAESHGTDWVFVDEKETVVGCFGLNRSTSPVIGPNAGFNICLDPSIQRRGLGMVAYNTMIARADELGISYMNGSTSNPGVIAIATRIGRSLDNWLLRKDRPWIEDALALDPSLTK